MSWDIFIVVTTTDSLPITVHNDPNLKFKFITAVTVMSDLLGMWRRVVWYTSIEVSEETSYVPWWWRQ
jgi:hypothetical protein